MTVDPPGLTWCDTPGDTLPLKFALPAYVAVSVFAPVVVDVRLHVVAGSVMTQLSVPSLTVTDPVGVPAPGATADTTAVTVYAALEFDGSGVSAVMAVVVLALLTVTVPLPAPDELLAANVAVPA